jgi:hypothetical protein
MVLWLAPCKTFVILYGVIYMAFWPSPLPPVLVVACEVEISFFGILENLLQTHSKLGK